MSAGADDPIPFAVPDISEREVEAAAAAVRSGWLTTGPRTAEFEQLFAEFIGAKHAIAVNSCTAAMHLSLEALSVGPGDRVLTTPFTFTATAEVIRYLGADPVFVDIDADTFNLDPDRLEDKLLDGSEYAAVLPVHYAGHACDMSRVLELARRHGTKVVEDAAHALPTRYKGRLIGKLGDLTAFSFYATKTLATGEGGMVTTESDDWAARVRTMRLHGIDRDVFRRYQSDKPAWYYEVVAPGYKYNMTDVAAAIGIQQLARLEKMRNRREQIADRYSRSFSGLPARTPVTWDYCDTHSWHLYPLLLDTARLTIDRDRFIEMLSERGVGASVHFIPLHLQPYWRDRYSLTPHQFPVASAVFERIVSLPLYSSLTDQQVDRVINTVASILETHARR